jgi:hypothetical protein
MDAPRPSFELRDRALEFELRPPWWGRRLVRVIIGAVLGMIGPPLVVHFTAGRFPVPSAVMVGSIGAAAAFALLLPVPAFPRRVRFSDAGFVLIGPRRQTPVAWASVLLAAGRVGLNRGPLRAGHGMAVATRSRRVRSGRLLLRLTTDDARRALRFIAPRAATALVLPLGGVPALPVQPDGTERGAWLEALRARVRSEFNTQAAGMAWIAAASLAVAVFMAAMTPAAFARGHPRAVHAAVLAFVATGAGLSAASRAARAQKRKQECIAALDRDAAREAPFHYPAAARRPGSRAA